MIGAGLYIILCSLKNRTIRRIRRLREPRYLVGALVAATYFYFAFGGFGRRRTSPRPAPELNRIAAALPAGASSLAGLALMAVVAVSWIWPIENLMLQFSRSEVQFLFTAPVSRRSLLQYRILKAQVGLLFASLISAIAFRASSGAGQLRWVLAMWLMFATLRLHFTGVALLRSNLAEHPRAWRRQWPVVAVFVGALSLVAWNVGAALWLNPPASFRAGLDTLGSVASEGAVSWILWPFLALERPILAAWPGPFFAAISQALVVLAVNYVWVLSSDAQFQEAAAQYAARRADQPGARVRALKNRRAPIELATAGRLEGAIVWKSLMQIARGMNLRLLGAMLAAGIVLVGVLAARPGFSSLSRLAGPIGALALVNAVLTIVFAPQAMRMGLRSDLAYLDVLKTWPVSGAVLLRAEVLAPTVLLSVVACTLVSVGALLGGAAAPRLFPHTWLPWATVAALIVIPGLTAMQIVIQNAIVVLFPAWASLGQTRSRGLEVIGQRMLTLGGALLALAVAAVPGLVIGGGVAFVLWRVIGPAALVLAAAVLSAALLVEVILAIEVLGPVLERMDLGEVRIEE